MTDPGDKVKTAENASSKIWLRADGIVVVQLKPGARETLDSARQTAELSVQVAGTKAYACLVDMRAPFTADAGVREFFASRAETRALAILIDSGVGSIVGNLFFTLNEPRFPTRMFTAEREAIAWLRKIAKAP